MRAARKTAAAGTDVKPTSLFAVRTFSCPPGLCVHQRLARRVPQGRDSGWRGNTEGYPRGDGRQHRLRTVGQSESALRAVRQGLPATEGRFQAQRAFRAVPRLSALVSFSVRGQRL